MTIPHSAWPSDVTDALCTVLVFYYFCPIPCSNNSMGDQVGEEPGVLYNQYRRESKVPMIMSQPDLAADCFSPIESTTLRRSISQHHASGLAPYWSHHSILPFPGHINDINMDCSSAVSASSSTMSLGQHAASEFPVLKAVEGMPNGYNFFEHMKAQACSLLGATVDPDEDQHAVGEFETAGTVEGMAGDYDLFQYGTARGYNALETRATTDQDNAQHQLFGPNGHRCNTLDSNAVAYLAPVAPVEPTYADIQPAETLPHTTTHLGAVTPAMSGASLPPLQSRRLDSSISLLSTLSNIARNLGAPAVPMAESSVVDDDENFFSGAGDGWKLEDPVKKSPGPLGRFSLRRNKSNVILPVDRCSLANSNDFGDFELGPVLSSSGLESSGQGVYLQYSDICCSTSMYVYTEPAIAHLNCPYRLFEAMHSICFGFLCIVNLPVS